MTPDPAGAGAASGQDPVSWNRYAYTGGDPVNRGDPTGLVFYQGYEGCVANNFASDGTFACPINDDDGGGCAVDDASCDPTPCVAVDGTPMLGPYCQNSGLGGGGGLPPSTGGSGGGGLPFQGGTTQTCPPGYISIGQGKCLPYNGALILKLVLPGTNY
jgi:hypothetical protein